MSDMYAFSSCTCMLQDYYAQVILNNIFIARLMSRRSLQTLDRGQMSIIISDGRFNKNKVRPWVGQPKSLVELGRYACDSRPSEV